MTAITLENRAFIAVAGEDAGDFLQGIVTTDVPGIGPRESFAGALLTPQGKILFEFMIARIDGGFLIETDADYADALAKRLMLYRLRARITIERRPASSVSLTWDAPAPDGAFRDMRFATAGFDLFRRPGGNGGAVSGDYAALRILHGISGGAEDGNAGDFFPHDLLMDRNGGLNFQKGCYVGQEVVSRMQHRSTARRRLVIVEAAAELPAAGTAILAGSRDIGALRTVSGRSGLAVVRIDKAGEAMAGGEEITAGTIPVRLSLPGWSGLTFPVSSGEAAS